MKRKITAQPLMWVWFFILMGITLISTKKVVHLASFWKLGFLELRSGLLTILSLVYWGQEVGSEIEKFYFLWCFYAIQVAGTYKTKMFMKEGELQRHHCLRSGHLFDMTVKWPIQLCYVKFLSCCTLLVLSCYVRISTFSLRYRKASTKSLTSISNGSGITCSQLFLNSALK